MKLNKKILSVVVASSIISTSYITFASVTPAETTLKPIMEISTDNISEKAILEFGKFTGKITAIEDYKEANAKESNGSKIVSLTDTEGKEARLYLSEKTYYVNKDFKVGDTVTGFYQLNQPINAIYPPLYPCIVFAVNEESVSIKLDRFDENLLSYDKELKLNVSDKTLILDQDGKVFKGELKNRKLIVLYSITTMSIPPQTPPNKIIVLFEEALAPVQEIPGDENIPVTSEPPVTDKKLGLTVNNISLKNIAPFVNDKGVVMVPFRDACEALKLEITWNDKDKSIILDNKISFSVGKDAYKADKKIINLGTAPVIVNEKTFVPLKFFTEVLNLNNAYVLENTVVIDNGIKMD